jgi:hypothetical protein
MAYCMMLLGGGYGCGCSGIPRNTKRKDRRETIDIENLTAIRIGEEFWLRKLMD